MDGRHFDELTRRFTDGTRRRFLRAAGAVMASVVLGSRVGAAAAQAPAFCTQDSDCLAGAENPCSGATCLGGTCTFFIVTCILGSVCCGNGECCPEPAPCLSDADCLSADPDPCAEGFVCCHGACAASCKA